MEVEVGLSEMQCGDGEGLRAWEMEVGLPDVWWSSMHPLCWETQEEVHHLHTQQGMSTQSRKEEG